MKFYEIPCWLREGDLFKNLIEYGELTDDVGIELIHKIKTSSSINSLKEFKKVYEISGFWMLDSYPLDIYVYGFLNYKEVLEYLKGNNDFQSNELHKDIRKNISLKKYESLINDKFKNEEISMFYNEEKRSIEAHNRILFFIQKNVNILFYMESWHGKHHLNFENYEDWIDNIKHNLTKKKLIRKFPKFYQMNLVENEEFFDYEENNDEQIEIIKFLGKFYPSLNYGASGSMIDINPVIIENIIMPLMFDTEFSDTKIE